LFPVDNFAVLIINSRTLAISLIDPKAKVILFGSKARGDEDAEEKKIKDLDL
jgi:hypothetical protein